MKSIIFIVITILLLGNISLFAQGKFSGYMFGDYYFNVMRDTSFNRAPLANSAAAVAGPGGENMQAFQFRRIYLTYDNDISEKFTTRIRLEADQAQQTVDGTKSTVAGSKISVFLKDAYLKWKNIFSGSDLTFGIQPTPAFEISEAGWGYRPLEKTILDLRGIVSARDLAVSLRGKIVEDGTINYWVMIGNNSGNGPETDKYKRYYANIQYRPNENFQATLYADYKDAAKVAAGENGIWTTALFAGYTVPSMYNIGAEAYISSQANAFSPASGPLEKKNGSGISVFGSYYIIPELSAVVRYDHFDPNTSGDANAGGDIRNYIITGLSWKVDKNVSIMPNVLYETYEAPANHGEPDPSITARITLFCVFL